MKWDGNDIVTISDYYTETINQYRKYLVQKKNEHKKENLKRLFDNR